MGLTRVQAEGDLRLMICANVRRRQVPMFHFQLPPS
jgi:hypothetical protein